MIIRRTKRPKNELKFHDKPHKLYDRKQKSKRIDFEE